MPGVLYAGAYRIVVLVRLVLAGMLGQHLGRWGGGGLPMLGNAVAVEAGAVAALRVVIALVTADRRQRKPETKEDEQRRKTIQARTRGWACAGGEPL